MKVNTPIFSCDDMQRFGDEIRLQKEKKKK